MPARFSPTWWRDPALAILLACVLTSAWTLGAWPALSRLHLPDTDDAMRLQQIRDWIAGQPFADLAQHRLGAPPGLEMHWSRLPDLVPAAIVALLTPVLGAHPAELFAVIAWPASLFAAALALTGGIARALAAPPPVAIIVAALAYPANSLFLPGRIDHHGFQIVLILLLVRALIGEGSVRAGIAAGLASVASLAIGLETAPLLAIGGAAAVVLWIADRPGARERLLGYGAALALGLGVAALVLGTSGWTFPACDGFDRTLWRGAQAAAFAPLALAGLRLATTRARLIAGLLAALAAGGAVATLAPACLRPYGEVDPVLARLWLSRVAEAQPLFGAPAADAIAYAGLALAGAAAGAGALFRHRRADWAIPLAFQLAALGVTLFQLRGAYPAAILAAPALAAMIAAARARGPLPLAGAWLVATGILYPIAAAMLAPAPTASASAPDCTGPRALDRLAALPPGRLLASVDLGAYAVAATRHGVVAAPYHRNNRGNRAMYDAFRGEPARAEAIARRWGVAYLAWCPGDFADADPGSLAGLIRAGRPPAWLVPLSPPGEAPRLYRLE